MISNRPYLIRAMFDWIIDNQWTPHIQVDANYPGVKVPTEHVQDGMIVLNMHPQAVRNLDMANDWFSFKARFQGIEREIGFFPEAVLAVFARENGQGMPFPPEPYPEEGDDQPMNVPKPVESAMDKLDTDGSEHKKQASTSSKSKKKSHLSIVK